MPFPHTAPPLDEAEVDDEELVVELDEVLLVDDVDEEDELVDDEEEDELVDDEEEDELVDEDEDELVTSGLPVEDDVVPPLAVVDPLLVIVSVVSGGAPPAPPSPWMSVPCAQPTTAANATGSPTRKFTQHLTLEKEDEASRAQRVSPNRAGGQP